MRDQQLYVKDGNSRSITLKDDDLALVEQMLLWLYNQEYPATTVEREEEALVLDAKMYGLADKYNLGQLKEVTKECFKIMLKAYWNTDRFAKAATVVWQTTPDSDVGLRQLVSKNLWSQREKLLSRRDVKVLLKELNGFSGDLMLVLAKDRSW